MNKELKQKLIALQNDMNAHGYSDGVEKLNSIFPELQENESGKIKKAITAIVNDWWDKAYCHHTSVISREQMLNWISEQGTQESYTHRKTQEYLNGYARVQGYEDLTEWEKMFDNVACSYANRKDNEGYNASWYVKERVGEMLFHAKQEIKRQGEKKQKEAIAPKFHEGEWVVFECGEKSTTLQISRIIEGTYEFTDDSFLDVADEDSLHLWTINDAKDGDVLASGEVVFVFKVIHGVWLNCHYSAHKDGSFNADSYDLLTNKYFGEVYPATKEQRKFLFQKMHDAGYEWDTIKLELKEIDYKSERGNKSHKLSSDEEFILARIMEYLEDNDCPDEWRDFLHDIYSSPYQKQDEQPEHGYLKTTYYCGKKPRWAIGDTLAYYEVYSDKEGECVLGKVTKVEFDNQEKNDWVYTFEDGSANCEQALLKCATYKKK